MGGLCLQVLSTGLGRDRVSSCFLSLIPELMYICFLGVTHPSEKPVSIGYVRNIAKLIIIMLISERRGVTSFACRLHAKWNNQKLMLSDRTACPVGPEVNVRIMPRGYMCCHGRANEPWIMSLDVGWCLM